MSSLMKQYLLQRRSVAIQMLRDAGITVSADPNGGEIFCAAGSLSLVYKDWVAEVNAQGIELEPRRVLLSLMRDGPPLIQIEMRPTPLKESDIGKDVVSLDDALRTPGIGWVRLQSDDDTKIDIQAGRFSLTVDNKDVRFAVGTEEFAANLIKIRVEIMQGAAPRFFLQATGD